MTPTIEKWLPVVGWSGLYEVSDLGRVRSVDRQVLCASGNTQRYRGRVLSPKRQPDGRQFVNLSKQGRPRLHAVSVLVLEAFAGPRPGDHFGCHSNGDPADNALSNLRWDTPSGNNYDRITHGRDRQASKTHCPRGHLLTMPNLVTSKLRRGHRNCLACDRGKHSVASPDEHYRRIMQSA